MKYHLITDRTLYAEPLASVAAAAEAARVDYFQLREKDLPSKDMLALARSIRLALDRTIFIVNGALDIALASGADGVHLQSDNIPVQEVRAKYGNLIIGYSAHSLDEMKTAAENGASYVFISPIFEPRSKVSSLPVLGPSVIVSWSRSCGIPVVALGGVSSKNLLELKTMGCEAVAGISFFIQDGKFTAKGMVA